ncbi:MAG: sigma-70 family RNA polymerase sigma factor [Eubacterium sp.]|nr:sigma-70 family RNA polymerase sigma factor [Eubacterium sp.]
MDDFEIIYKKYSGTVKKYIMSLGADYNLSDDITADTFMKALKNIEKFDEQYNVLTWLCTIAKRTYFDYLKRKDNTTLQFDDELILYDDQIDTQIEDNEQKVLIYRAIIKLDSPYKDVIYLRLFADLSFYEIGQILSKNENWARVTFYRGKTKLKEVLENEI